MFLTMAQLTGERRNTTATDSLSEDTCTEKNERIHVNVVDDALSERWDAVVNKQNNYAKWLQGKFTMGLIH